MIKTMICKHWESDVKLTFVERNYDLLKLGGHQTFIAFKRVKNRWVMLHYDYGRTLELSSSINIAKVKNYDCQSLVTNNILVELRGLEPFVSNHH